MRGVVRLARPLPILPHHAPDIVERMHAFDRWDAEQRRKAGPLAGLRFHWNHGPHLSRHWPHLLCWQWMIRYEPPRYKGKPGFWRFGPGAAGGDMIGLRLPLLGAIVYQRQASDRIAAFGTARRTAPVIFKREHDPANGDDA